MAASGNTRPEENGAGFPFALSLLAIVLPLRFGEKRLEKAYI
jgi:hypothetical protein